MISTLLWHVVVMQMLNAWLDECIPRTRTPAGIGIVRVDKVKYFSRHFIVLGATSELTRCRTL